MFEAWRIERPFSVGTPVGRPLELPLNPGAPEPLVGGGKTNSEGPVTEVQQSFGCESVQRPVPAAAVDALPTLGDSTQPEVDFAGKLLT